MVQFCMAYCGILAKHNICATGTTGKFVEEATGLKIDKCLAGMQGLSLIHIDVYKRQAYR